MSLTVLDLIRQSHETAVQKGWWETGDRPVLEQFFLMAGELHEAGEDHANDHAPDEVFFSDQVPGSSFKKPCGIPVELADVLIRMADTIGKYNCNLCFEEVIRNLTGLTETAEIDHLVDSDFVGTLAADLQEENATFHGQLFLIEGFLHQAGELWRSGNEMTYVFHDGQETYGVPVQLAKLFLSVLALCRLHRINIVEALVMKLAYNTTRPHRHGGKRA